MSLINIDKDPELNALGFETLLTVHDEIIGQCPAENAEKVVELLPKIMIETALKGMESTGLVPVDMKCDGDIERHWYEGEVIGMLNSHYNKFIEKGMSEEEALNALYEENAELTPEQIHGVLVEHKEGLF